METFEQYLKANLKEGSEFRLVITDAETMTFLIHPLGRDGTTIDAMVVENKICMPALFAEIWKGIREQLDAE